MRAEGKGPQRILQTLTQPIAARMEARSVDDLSKA